MREWRGGIKVVFQLKKARVNIKQLEKQKEIEGNHGYYCFLGT